MTEPTRSGRHAPPSAAELKGMSYEQLIDQIVADGQWGNSAIAEIQRRSTEAALAQGKTMFWLTLTIGALAAVQVVLAIWVASAASNARIDDLRSETQTNRVEIRTDVRRVDDRLRAVEVAIGKLNDEEVCESAPEQC